MNELHRERRSCSVLKPANDWLRIMPFGPPGEWVPVAMISGTRDDTPLEKLHDSGSSAASPTVYLRLSIHA